MKKKYEKPMIAISLFELQQNIAAACAAYTPDNSFGRPAQNSIGTCGWDADNEVVFAFGQEVCTSPWFEELDHDGICYNNPNGGMSIFGAS